MSDKIKIDINNLQKLIDNHTREEIAKSICCDTSLVTKHYNGDRALTLDYAIKYADFFDVSLDHICGRTEDKTTDNDVRFVSKYTGLSADAVEKLERLKFFSFAHHSVVKTTGYWYFYDNQAFIDSLLINLDEKEFFYNVAYYRDLIKNAVEAMKKIVTTDNLDEIERLWRESLFNQKLAKATLLDLQEPLNNILLNYLHKNFEDIETLKKDTLDYISKLQK